MALLNQYSYVLLALLISVVLARLLWRAKRLHPVLRAGLLILLIMTLSAFGLSRRQPAPSVGSISAAEAILTNEQPTFVMLYSNY